MEMRPNCYGVKEKMDKKERERIQMLRLVFDCDEISCVL